MLGAGDKHSIILAPTLDTSHGLGRPLSPDSMAQLFQGILENPAPPPKAKKAKKTLFDSEGNQIKKNLTSFFHFSSARREAVKAELQAELNENAASAAATGEDEPPTKLPGGAVAKRLGELWKAMSDADKQQYVTAAMLDKLRYDTAVASNPATNAAEEADK